MYNSALAIPAAPAPPEQAAARQQQVARDRVRREVVHLAAGFAAGAWREVGPARAQQGPIAVQRERAILLPLVLPLLFNLGWVVALHIPFSIANFSPLLHRRCVKWRVFRLHRHGVGFQLTQLASLKLSIYRCKLFSAHGVLWCFNCNRLVKSML